MSKQIVNISSLLSFMLLLSGCGQETSLVPLPGNGGAGTGGDLLERKSGRDKCGGDARRCHYVDAQW